ncbi:MAG: helix-turn-helix domain-containing protein, partial [Vicinamibacteria bacterium]
MPVFTDPVSDYRQLRLGQSVRELRKNKGWTLKELASRIPMSVASISALENDKAALDLEQLVAVSEALGVRPDALLPKSRRSHFHLTRRATLESLPALPLRATDRSGTSTVTLGYNLLRPLAAPFVGRHIEPLHTELLPATDEEIRFVSQHDEEFLFVLRGAVECLLRTPDGEVKEELLPGDCMYFWSCLPHCLRAASGQSASVIRVLHSGYGAIGAERADAAIWVADGPRKSLTEQVALKICGLRKGAGLASAELARDLAIGVRRLADIERGRKPVTIDLLLRVCRRFRKPLEYFLVSTAMARPFHVVHRARDIVELPRRTRRRLVDSGWGQTEFRSLASGLE